MKKTDYNNIDDYYKVKRKHNKMYYSKTSNALNNGKTFTKEELKMIVDHNISDRELADKLGRSMKSIQNARNRVKHKKQKEQN